MPTKPDPSPDRVALDGLAQQYVNLDTYRALAQSYPHDPGCADYWQDKVTDLERSIEEALCCQGRHKGGET